MPNEVLVSGVTVMGDPVMGDPGHEVLTRPETVIAETVITETVMPLAVGQRLDTTRLQREPPSGEAPDSATSEPICPSPSSDFAFPNNRVAQIAAHIPWYGFRTQSRLARESGVSPSAISRLMRHRVQPTLRVSLAVTEALSRRLGRPLDVREVFLVSNARSLSHDSLSDAPARDYPTPCVCQLVGCRGCALTRRSSTSSLSPSHIPVT